MNLKELRAKREALANTARSILTRAEAEGRSLTSDELRDFDGVKAKMEALSQTIERAAQLGEIRADIERPIVSGPVVQQDGGMSYVPRNHNPGEVRVFRPNEAIAENRYSGPGLGSYVRGIVTGKWNGAEDLRALSEGSTPGSYLVPTPLSGYVIDLVRNQAQVVRAGAMTVPMDSATLKIGRLTSDVTSAWKAENAAMTFSDANFEVVTFTANTLLAGSKLSIEIVEDAVNIDQIVMNSITQSLALAVDYAALYGSGSSNQPKGVKNQTGVTLTSLATNGLTLTDFSTYSAGISTLMGYNFNGPFGILHSARTAGELDNLQDTLHQPLRQPDMVAAARKFTTNQIPNNLTQGSAATASDAFIGQWDMCLIGARTAMILEVSRQRPIRAVLPSLTLRSGFAPISGPMFSSFTRRRSTSFRASCKIGGARIAPLKKGAVVNLRSPFLYLGKGKKLNGRPNCIYRIARHGREAAPRHGGRQYRCRRHRQEWRGIRPPHGARNV